MSESGAKRHLGTPSVPSVARSPPRSPVMKSHSAGPERIKVGLLDGSGRAPALSVGVKSMSAGPERIKASLPAARLLSVDNEEYVRTGRRRSGSGLQDLSVSTSPQEQGKSKSKSLLNNFLLPINTLRKRSTSRDSSSSDAESGDSRSQRASGNFSKTLNADQEVGHKITFLSALAGGSKESRSLNNSRRNSVELAKDVKTTGAKDLRVPASKISHRKNSLDVARERKLAETRKEMKNRKPDAFLMDSEKSPSQNRRDSLDVLKLKKLQELELQKNKKANSKDKTKLTKMKSLGESFSLKIPGSHLRRNSFDAFSFKNLFGSLSRKNSTDDLKNKDKKTPGLENLLKVQHTESTQRRHSVGGGDAPSNESSHVYRPISVQRRRLGSYGRYSEDRPARSVTPSIVISTNDDYPRSKARRTSGPDVVVSPPSGSSSDGSNSVYSSCDENYSSRSMSHSSISSLESGKSPRSGRTSDSDEGDGIPRYPNRRLKKHGARLVKQQHVQHRSRTSSTTTEDDVFDSSGSSSSSGSYSEDEADAIKIKENAPPVRGEFWASLQAGPPPMDVGGSSEEDLLSMYDSYLFPGEDHGKLCPPEMPGRRNSGDLNERSRQNSGSLTSVYIRGCDPAVAASVFRESRGLPSADPLLQQLAKEEESQILVKFFQLHRSHDLIPTSAKLVIFDTSLQVKKAFYALVHNGVRAAPLWDRDKQKFVGLLTITDFIRILHSFHLNQDPQMENLEDHRLHMWRTFLKDDDRPLIHINPEDSLYEAIRLLIHHKIHRLPVIDPATGNVLYIITHKRILKFLYLYISELPKPQVLQKTLAELGIGTYTDIETATQDTLIIEALDKFVKHRVSALPIVDSDGKLIDIYAKFDVINLAAEGTYNNLNVTLRQANESRNEWFEGVQHCTKDERLCTVMDRIVRAEVHRLVVVDDSRKVIGVISLSDILKELVLKPCDDENLLKKASVCDMVKDEIASEAALLSSPSSPSPQPPLSPPSAAVPLTKSGSEESCGDTDHLTEGIGSPEGGKVSSGDSEDEGRYSMDKSEETPPVPSPEGIPISG
ncbi:CBS domain [Trinorchestia longiramus]|nr:CBS domain [Trinorchestia longiramus]